jgi:excisionase family DNA binding protein
VSLSTENKLSRKAKPAAVPVEKRTYSVEESAIILGVGKSSFYEAVERKEVPAIRIGRSIRIPMKWVDAKVEALS